MALLASYVSHTPVDDFGLTFSSLKYSASLAATTDTPLTIPGSAHGFKAVIKVSGPAWVNLNALAAVPAGASFVTPASELVNVSEHLCREVKAGDVLHFFATSAATNVSVVLYALITPN